MLFLSAWLTSCATRPTANQQAHPAGPILFAPNTISVGNVYKGSFTPDGKTFYFFKQVTEGEEDYRIFRSYQTDGQWSTPEQVHLGGDFSDLYPAISPSGQRLVFSSYRPAPGDTSSHPNAHLWYTEWQGEDWGTPVFMNDANAIGHYHSGTYFRPDGTLYFTRTTPDWQHAQSLVMHRSGTAYSEPELVISIERWKTWRDDLHVWGGTVAPDGSFTILDVSERNTDTGRPGPSDPWVTLLQPDGTWSEPRRMDALSSDGYDNFVFFSPDGEQVFFVRDFNAFYTIPSATALASAR